MLSFKEIANLARQRLTKAPIRDQRREQAFIREIPKPMVPKEESSLSGPTRVTYSRRLKRVLCSRYLIGKLVYSPEKVNFAEVLVLFDNQLWLEDKAEHDPGFRQKFGGTLEALSNILKRTPDVGSSSSYIARLSKECKSQLEGFYPPERNLSTMGLHVIGLFHVEGSKSLGRDVKTIPPKGHIGKGYSDKGTRRDPAYDGSPHWTDVAIHNSRKEG